MQNNLQGIIFAKISCQSVVSKRNFQKWRLSWIPLLWIPFWSLPNRKDRGRDSQPRPRRPWNSQWLGEVPIHRGVTNPPLLNGRSGNCDIGGCKESRQPFANLSPTPSFRKPQAPVCRGNLNRALLIGF